MTTAKKPGSRAGRSSRGWALRSPCRGWSRSAWPRRPRPCRRSAAPAGVPLRPQRQEHGRLDAERPKGQLDELPAILEPLDAVQGRPARPDRPDADKARANGDGPGDHARAMAAFLTGCQPRKTDGADIRVGISVDQVAASRVGDQTRFPSLEIGCERGPAGRQLRLRLQLRLLVQPLLARRDDAERQGDRPAGWSSSACSAAATARNRPRPARSATATTRASSTSSARTPSDLQKPPRRRPTSGSSTSTSTASARSSSGSSRRRASAEPQAAPSRTWHAADRRAARDYQEHIRLMGDLLVLAFQADVTRVCTSSFANEGSNRPYPFIGVPRGPPRPVAPRQRPEEAREDPQDQPLPHRAVRLPARRS